MEHSNSVRLLRALVAAHETPHPRTGSREAIMYIRSFGSSGFKNETLRDEDLPPVDDALLEEMSAQGTIDIDRRKGAWMIVPTAYGREVVASLDRAENTTPVASLDQIIAAVDHQAASSNKFAWTVVRPVLSAVKDYWESGGYSRHGVTLVAILEGLTEANQKLFLATSRTLVEADYLRPNSSIDFEGVPAEFQLTDRTHAVLDGWPGAAPDDLFENLIAVLKDEAETAETPAEKKKFERVVETFRELGVATAGEVLAKVATGGV